VGRPDRFRSALFVVVRDTGTRERQNQDQSDRGGEGPLGALLGGMLGPQVSKEFGTLLGNLAKKAEAA
jgi:hypothetical protein